MPGRESALATEPSPCDLPRWSTEIIAGRFRIHCDFELTSRDALIRELNGIQEDLSTLLGQPRRMEPIHIVLFHTEREYQRYMQNYFPRLPQRRAFFLQDRGPGMLFTHWHADVATDLRHEVTHALLNHKNRSLPLWLDEGIAEYFEVAPVNRFDASKYVAEVQKLSEQGRVQSLKSLRQKNKLALFGDSEYRDSWAWVHFLMHRNAHTREILVRYLQEYHAPGNTGVVFASFSPRADAGFSEVSRSRSRLSGRNSAFDEPRPTSGFDLDRALRMAIPNLEEEFAEHFRSLSVLSQ